MTESKMTPSTLRSVTRLVRVLHAGKGGGSRYNHQTFSAMLDGGFALYREMTAERSGCYEITDAGKALIGAPDFIDTALVARIAANTPTELYLEKAEECIDLERRLAKAENRIKLLTERCECDACGELAIHAEIYCEQCANDYTNSNTPEEL